MTYSFEAIEKQAQETHSKTAAILQKKDSFWKQHGRTAGIVALSISLLGFSFFAPQTNTFKAALMEAGVIPEENTTVGESQLIANATQNTITEASEQTEASDITIEPLQNTLSEETDTEALKKALTQISGTENVETTSENTPEDIIISEISDTSIATPEIPQTEELNPFSSVIESRNQNIPEVESIETLHGSAPVIEESSDIEIPTNSTSESLPFKENTHTTDSTSILEENTLPETLSSTEEESLHAASTIVKQDDDSVFGTHRYTGIILNKTAKKGFSFSYYLELDGGERLTINTQRDLRNIHGKEATIEVEGTRENFVLKHLYYNPKAPRNLPQSGPEMVILLSGLIAVAGGWLMRKKA